MWAATQADMQCAITTQTTLATASRLLRMCRMGSMDHTRTTCHMTACLSELLRCGLCGTNVGIIRLQQELVHSQGLAWPFDLEVQDGLHDALGDLTGNLWGVGGARNIDADEVRALTGRAASELLMAQQLQGHHVANVSHCLPICETLTVWLSVAR